MIRFEVPYESVKIDYLEKTYEFVNALRNSTSLTSDLDLDEIKWEYSWGFYVKDTQDHEERILRDIEEIDKLTYKFPERLEYELEKIKLNLIMSAGNFSISDGLIGLPEEVISIACEVIKIMMFEEQKRIKDREIIKSIPAIKLDIPDVFLEEFYDEKIMFEEKKAPSVPLTVDNILDKISEYGIDSLTMEEFNFLDNLK